MTALDVILWALAVLVGTLCAVLSILAVWALLDLGLDGLKARKAAPTTDEEATDEDA